jgi:hypothetical protein
MWCLLTWKQTLIKLIYKFLEMLAADVIPDQITGAIYDIHSNNISVKRNLIYLTGSLSMEK